MDRPELGQRHPACRILEGLAGPVECPVARRSVATVTSSRARERERPPLATVGTADSGPRVRGPRLSHDVQTARAERATCLDMEHASFNIIAQQYRAGGPWGGAVPLSSIISHAARMLECTSFFPLLLNLKVCALADFARP